MLRLSLLIALCLGALVLLTPAVSAQFSGTLTVDPSLPPSRSNFQTIQDAADALASDGVAGAVTVEITPDAYEERVTISAIPGAASTKHVTFLGLGSGAGRPLIRFVTQRGSDWIVRVDADHVSLVNLRVEVAEVDDDTGTAVHITDASSDVIVDGCEILGAPVGVAGRAAYGVLSEAYDVLVSRTAVSGGAIGIGFLLRGGSHTPDYDRGVRSNTVTDPGTMGIQVAGLPLHRSQPFLVEDNQVQISTTPFGLEGVTALAYAIAGITVEAPDANVLVADNTVTLASGTGIHYDNLAGEGGSAAVDGNTVTVTGTGSGLVLEGPGASARANRVTVGTGTAVRMADSDGRGATGDARPVLANTMATVQTSGVGIDLDNADLALVAFNSAVVLGGSEPSVHVHGGAAGLSVVNNLFAQRGTGARFDLEGGSGVAEMDYNLYDEPGEFQTGNLFRVDWKGTSYADLYLLTDAAGVDANGAMGAVTFADAASGDLHIAGSSVGDDVLSGIAISEVTTDLDGDVRPDSGDLPNRPYVGADEAATPVQDGTLPLIGTYTIDPALPAAPPNYTSLADARFALEWRGVSGPVTFEIAGGPLAVTTGNNLTYFRGMRETRPVRFVAAPGAATPPTVSAGATGSFFGVENVKHISFEGIHFGRYVQSKNNDDVSIVGGFLEGINAVGGSDLLIEGVEGGAKGLELRGVDGVTVRGNHLLNLILAIPNVIFPSTYLPGTGLVVEDNTLTVTEDAAVFRGISASGYRGVVVRGNTIDATAISTTAIQVGGSQVVWYQAGTVAIEDNVILGTEGAGIEFDVFSSTSGPDPIPGPLTIANNTVRLMDGYGIRGDWFEGTPTLIAHNTVVNSVTNRETVILGGLGAPGDGSHIDLLANVIVNESTGRALEVRYADDLVSMDYNVLATRGATLAALGGALYADLAAIQAGTPWEDHGASFVPDFADLGSGDLHFAGASLGDLRLSTPRLAEVLTDLDGDTRDDPTYRGADQPDTPLAALVEAVAILQGAWDGSAMRTDLRDADLIPLAQPYADDLYDGTALDYDGTETTTPSVLASNAVVDWVLVELRAAPDGASDARFAALLLADGTLLAPDGSGVPAIASLAPGAYHLIVRHRNHLAVMSLAATALGGGPVDLSAPGAAWGANATVDLGGGVVGLVAGDGDGDGSVLATDQQTVWVPTVGQTGYAPADFNLDADVLADDVQTLFEPNVGRQSGVPGTALRQPTAPTQAD